ncbi:Rieske 2Fe-2S domain-containing protein [Reyranella sp.]|uniref:Rieske 2Fe-2S domain-containing protein n=1 Tax=Reyranella sp. TaxID=1929291 RepID=UPI003BAD7AC1
MKPSWTVESQAKFAASFARTNYRFRYFNLVLETGGDVIDVVFNYKDLAHLKVVHNTFDIFYSHISDDVQSCVVMQRLFGLNFPLTHLALQLAENRLFFHDSFLNVLLTSEVVADPLADHRVRVTTTYGIGAPRLLLPIVFPVLKWLLTRNYHVLMEGDVPMRDRRGELRRWGMRLPMTSYPFQDTLDLTARHVVPTEQVAVPEPASIPLASLSPGVPILFGRSDNYGLQVVRRDDVIEIFPRMCPHEGACLDQKEFKASSLSCCWHGRRFGPIVRFPLSEGPSAFAGPFHRFVVTGSELRIEPVALSEKTAQADWTTAVRRTAS